MKHSIVMAGVVLLLLGATGRSQTKDDKAPPLKNETGPVGHRDQVFSIALSKDGKFLASAGADTSVLIWDLSRALERSASTSR